MSQDKLSFSDLVPAELLQQQTIKTNSLRRAVGYTRVSTPDQVLKVSLDGQRSNITNYAARNGITVVKWFEDAGISAYSGVNRPAFEEALTYACHYKEIDCLLVDSYRAFSRRDELESAELELRLKAHGVDLVPIDNPADTQTIPGIWSRGIQRLQARTESVQTSIRTLDKMSANAQNLDPVSGWKFKNGGTAPYGYQNESVIRGHDRSGKPIYRLLWQLDEREFAGKKVWEWVRWIILASSGVLGQPWSLRKLRNHLNQLGVPSPRGGIWGASTLKAILEWDRALEYAGFYVWNRKPRRTAKKPKNEAEKWVFSEAAHPAIISLEEYMNFKDGQKKRIRNVPPAPSAKTSRFLFTSGNFFTCAHCGRNMRSKSVKLRGKTYDYYVCSGYLNFKEAGCTQKERIPVAWAESCVVEEIRRRFLNESQISEWMKKLNAMAGRENIAHGSSIKKLRASQVKIKSEIDILVNRLANDSTGEIYAELKEGIQSRKNRLRKLEEEIEALENYTPPPVRKITESEISETLTGFLQTFETGSFADQKQLLRIFVQRIVADPSAKTIRAFYFEDPYESIFRYSDEQALCLFDKIGSAGRGT